MEIKTFATVVPDAAVTTSRLPAGSTFKVGDIHVPHPQAEVNLPGAGDPRLGDTKAVTEFVKHDATSNTAEVVQEPLHDDVKPKIVTVREANTDEPTSADAKLLNENPVENKVV